jgi:hypothetical protein
MNTAHTIRFMTTINRDQALLKSILATFGHQRHADWRYQPTGAVNIIILDSDECSAQDIVEAHQMADEIVYYTQDTSLATKKHFVLAKPAQARHFVQLLEQLQQHLLLKEQDYTKPRLDALSDSQLQRHTLAYS